MKRYDVKCTDAVIKREHKEHVLSVEWVFKEDAYVPVSEAVCPGYSKEVSNDSNL